MSLFGWTICVCAQGYYGTHCDQVVHLFFILISFNILLPSTLQLSSLYILPAKFLEVRLLNDRTRYITVTKNHFIINIP